MIRTLLILASAVLAQGATAYYVNPLTGSDSNSGLTANAAWQTSAKITGETASGGLLASGDTLIIDTSSAVLSLTSTTLAISTSGITVRPPTGQTVIDTKAWQTLTNSSFTQTVGFTNTWQTTDTQTNIVAWEDSKWLLHIAGASWAAVSDIVDSTAGTFYTDGTNLFLHPLGNTNPTTDGKVYERSKRFTLGSAIVFAGLNQNISGFKVQKTALIEKADNLDAVGTTGIATANGFGGTSIISNCYVDYAGKHGLSLLGDASNSDITVQDCQSEQCYPGAAQTPWVSYMSNGNTYTNNIHRYVRCVTLKNAGLVGSTGGQNTDNSNVFLSHNSGGAFNFRTIYFTDCYFPFGGISPSVCTNVFVSGTRLSQFTVNEPITTVDRCLFDYGFVNQNYTISPSVIVRNSIFLPTKLTGVGGCQTIGTFTVQGCTFNLAGITNSDSELGILTRISATTLTFQNNIVIIPTNRTFTVFQVFRNTDTITANNNNYRLGYNSKVAYNYNDGSTTVYRTFYQWQALGFDANSLNTDPLVNGAYRPFPTSPTIGAGVDLGPMVDYSGVLFPVRNTIGAYEYVWLPASSLSGRVTTSGNVKMQ